MCCPVFAQQGQFSFSGAVLGQKEWEPPSLGPTLSLLVTEFAPARAVCGKNRGMGTMRMTQETKEFL